MLAKTDFKLRYQNSVLGYVWAVLKPLFMFAVLNFVFSSIFNPRNIGGEHYTLGLLVGLMLFYFFDEGTKAGMVSLKLKSELVSKIYIPRWTIIVASTIHISLIFIFNLIVVILFFVWFQFLPSLMSILLFLVFSFLLYFLILSVALLTAPLLVKFRDLGMIWEVLVNAMFYASPIFYPLQILPEWIQRFLLINPVAFIVHFSKEAMFNNHFTDCWKLTAFCASSVLFFLFSIRAYNKLIPNVAESL